MSPIVHYSPTMNANTLKAKSQHLNFILSVSFGIQSAGVEPK